MSQSSKTLICGRHESPFGPVVIGIYEGLLARLAFLTDSRASAASIDTALRWPHGPVQWAPEESRELAAGIFESGRRSFDDLPLFLDGTDFQCRVWEALCEIPAGSTVSYGELAQRVGLPKAARAIGNAVGANPIAYVVPCHRVLRADGGLGGYRWGSVIKRALLEREGSVAG